MSYTLDVSLVMAKSKCVVLAFSLTVTSTMIMYISDTSSRNCNAKAGKRRRSNTLPFSISDVTMTIRLTFCCQIIRQKSSMVLGLGPKSKYDRPIQKLLQ